jgi:CRP-like cAMP-binding protein
MMNAREKLALALIVVINSFGFDPKDPQRLLFTPSRKDLSSIAGITYETVVRMLSEFDSERIIRLEGKAIRILDLPELIHVCHKYY